MSQERWQQILAVLDAKCASDGAFRQALREHPLRAIQAATGEILPDNLQVQVVDVEAADITIVMPRRSSGAELSAHQLESVVGGLGAHMALLGLEGPRGFQGIVGPSS